MFSAVLSLRGVFFSFSQSRAKRTSTQVNGIFVRQGWQPRTFAVLSRFYKPFVTRNPCPRRPLTDAKLFLRCRYIAFDYQISRVKAWLSAQHDRNVSKASLPHTRWSQQRSLSRARNVAKFQRFSGALNFRKSAVTRKAVSGKSLGDVTRIHVS